MMICILKWDADVVVCEMFVWKILSKMECSHQGEVRDQRWDYQKNTIQNSTSTLTSSIEQNYGISCVGISCMSRSTSNMSRNQCGLMWTHARNNDIPFTYFLSSNNNWWVNVWERSHLCSVQKIRWKRIPFYIPDIPYRCISSSSSTPLIIIFCLDRRSV